MRQANARLDLAIRSLQRRDLGSRHARRGVRRWDRDLDQRLGTARPRAARGGQPVRELAGLLAPRGQGPAPARSTPTSIGETKEYKIEYRIRHRDGSYRWMLARGTAIRDQAGKPIRLVGSRVDITELKRVEEVLRESEAWFRFLANAMPQIVWTARPDRLPASTSINRCEEYHGHPGGRDARRQAGSFAIHPDDRDGAAASWMANIDGGQGPRHRVPPPGRRRPLSLVHDPRPAGARRLGPGRQVVGDLHRHRRAQAGRGGCARASGGSAPWPRRCRIWSGLPSRTVHRLLQRPQHRIHWTHLRTAPGLGLAADHPSRRPAGCLDYGPARSRPANPTRSSTGCADPTGPTAGISRGRCRCATTRAG